jgi:hypothetical protein
MTLKVTYDTTITTQDAHKQYTTDTPVNTDLNNVRITAETTINLRAPDTPTTMTLQRIQILTTKILISEQPKYQQQRTHNFQKSNQKHVTPTDTTPNRKKHHSPTT